MLILYWFPRRFCFLLLQRTTVSVTRGLWRDRVETDGGVVLQKLRINSRDQSGWLITNYREKNYVIYIVHAVYYGISSM